MFRTARKPDAIVDRKMIKMTVMVIMQNALRKPTQRIESQLRMPKIYDSNNCYLQMQAKC